MLNFKKFEIEDIDIYRKYTLNNKEFSCENSFVNLLVWQCAYNNMYAVEDGQLFIKSGTGAKESFRLPVGGDVIKGIQKIEEYCGEKKPVFWLQEGERLQNAKEYLNKNYIFAEKRDASDYIYLQSDLSNLAGKKYHSKRNHISAFTKKYEWKFEEIGPYNIDAVKECAEEWYKQNKAKEDYYLLCEKKGLETILNNMEQLFVKGGAIIVENRVVAFTLGTAINDKVFDIHVEKALKDYAEGYTVINREFARTLSDYEYINREDDMGLEGLRKAKLSYKPSILLNKYSCGAKE
jgi:hypothetical protein